MKRPTAAVTFPDGCVVTYSHPDGDEFPRADLTNADDHVDADHDQRVSEWVGKAFMQALRPPRNWWQDDCECSVLDTDGDRCGLSYPAGEPVHLCDHCRAHAAVAVPA